MVYTKLTANTLGVSADIYEHKEKYITIAGKHKTQNSKEMPVCVRDVTRLSNAPKITWAACFTLFHLLACSRHVLWCRYVEYSYTQPLSSSQSFFSFISLSHTLLSSPESTISPGARVLMDVTLIIHVTISTVSGTEGWEGFKQLSALFTDSFTEQTLV